jgi:hypothetical protein
MLKPNIFHGVAASEVARKLPHEFQGMVDTHRLQDDPYTVIAFPGMRGESTSVVDSKTLSKILIKAQTRNEPLVVVAHNFTSEAVGLLSQFNAVYFFKSDYFWSDERLFSIRDK